MAGYGCGLWDRKPGFEKPRDAFMPQIVKAQVFYPQNFAGARKGGADGVRVEREYPGLFARHGARDSESWFRQVAPNIVADLVAGVLHVRDENPAVFRVEALPCDPRDLLLAACRE